MGMTLQRLRHFVAVAETGQMTLAAQRCHISQPSMTTSLKHLEAEVGAPLFRRTSQGLKLTASGERLLRHADRILSSVSEALEDVRSSPDTLSGTVTIELTETVSAYFIPRVLVEVAQRFPGLEIRLVEEERQAIESAVINGVCDLAIVLVSNVTNHRDLAHTTLIHSPRKLWVNPNHPLLRKSEVFLSDVAREPFILLDMDDHTRAVRRYWGKYGLYPAVAYKSCSIEAVRSLVALGYGVTILSDLVFRRWSIDGQRIRRIELSDKVPSMDVGLIWNRRGNLSVGATAVREFLKTLNY